MPRHRERDVYARTLQGNNQASRFVDLSVEFVDAGDLSPLFAVGGRWDRKRKRWSDEEPRSSLQVRLAGDQIEPALFFRDWFEAYLSGDESAAALSIYSVLLLGGSRAGKTSLGKWLTLAFMVAVPGSRVWLVQPTKTDDDDELEIEFDEMIPPAWAVKAGGKYRLANGTTAVIRSGKYPARLKKGRCDWAFANEAQNMKALAIAMLRMRTSDTGGMVLAAANPPNNNPDGQHVADWKEDQERGERPNSKVFGFDPRNNPYIKQEQLLALAHEVDKRTFEIEVLGKVLQPSNAVLHAFSPIENVDRAPDFGDVTTAFAERCGMGSGVLDMVGLDFQASPHMAASIARAYENPEDERRPLLYYRKCILVELGDEYDLSDALYDAGLRPETTVLVGDASGEWQDGAHTKGGRSFDVLTECGWRRPLVPDRNNRKNPPIVERFKNDNRLFESQAGQRLVLIDPDANDLIQGCKLYRNGPNGTPSRTSQYAHRVDSMSYLNWRVYPRKVWNFEVGYKRLSGRKRRAQFKGI
jgi:hypothetical protein